MVVKFLVEYLKYVKILVLSLITLVLLTVPHIAHTNSPQFEGPAPILLDPWRPWLPWKGLVIKPGSVRNEHPVGLSEQQAGDEKQLPLAYLSLKISCMVTHQTCFFCGAISQINKVYGSRRQVVKINNQLLSLSL